MTPPTESFWTQVVGQAKTDTTEFWNAHRTATTIASPIVVAVVWTFFKGWHGWNDLWQAAMVSILVFLVLVAIVFIVSFVSAPAKVHVATIKEQEDRRVQVVEAIQRNLSAAVEDREQRIGTQAAEIAKLKHRILELETKPQRSKIDEDNFQTAKQSWDSLSEEVKQVIRCIYSHDGLVGGRVPPIPGVTQEQVNGILNNKLADVPFIRRVDRNDPGMGLRATWEIVPAYKAILVDLL